MARNVCRLSQSFFSTARHPLWLGDGHYRLYYDDLKLVWSPPWTKDKMSEAATLELNL